MNKQYTRAPHRSGAPSGTYSTYSSPNAALLIDFDNVTMAIRSNLAQELENLLNSEVIRGKVAVQRAYADWRRYPQYIVPLSESSIDLIFAPAYGSSKKNATDIRLAIDALELVFTRPEIGTYILLSGDSDFSSLVLKLKEYGKYVIGVGLQESSSDILVQNCDEYYSYNRLSGLKDAADMETQRHDPWELVERALQRMTERDDVMRSDRLKQVMLELDSGFDEGAIGYSKFNRFLAEAASRDKLRLRKAANGQYDVRPVGAGGSSRGGEEGDRPRVSRGRQERSRSAAESRGRSGRRSEAARETSDRGGAGGAGVSADALRSAYDLLAGAVGSLSKDGGSVRDSEVKRKMLAKEGDFDETALGFRKFSRFLQQAHDEGVVDLRQGDDGNYYLTPIEDGGSGRDVGAATGARESEAEPSEAPTETRKETARRGRRGGRRGRPDRTGPSEEGREEGTVVPGPVEVAGPKEEREEEREERGAVAAEAPAAEESAEGRDRGRRGLGRFRRGSRGGGGDGSGGPGAAGVGIGPVDASDEAAESPPERESAQEEPATAADRSGSEEAGPAASSRRSRGGLGRYRRGSRGAAPGAAPAAPAGSGDRRSGEATEASDGGPEAGGGVTGPAAADERDAIEHMVQNYPGVGERTASRLVEAFGEEVFEVIDREPERVAEVLSDRRAKAVIEGREAEKAGS